MNKSKNTAVGHYTNAPFGIQVGERAILEVTTWTGETMTLRTSPVVDTIVQSNGKIDVITVNNTWIQD